MRKPQKIGPCESSTSEDFRPFRNQTSELFRSSLDVSVEDMPILPEIVVGCLDNIAAFKHRDVSGNVVNGASEWAVRFISRVLREDPGAIVAAVEMQTGTAAEQSRQGAMRVARMLVVNSGVLDDGKVVFLNRLEVLEILEEFEPLLFASIPQSSRGKADWWKRARLTFLDQSRGNAKSLAYLRLRKKRKKG